jgi:hypothetical protein
MGVWTKAINLWAAAALLGALAPPASALAGNGQLQVQVFSVSEQGRTVRLEGRNVEHQGTTSREASYEYFVGIYSPEGEVTCRKFLLTVEALASVEISACFQGFEKGADCTSSDARLRAGSDPLTTIRTSAHPNRCMVNIWGK